MGILGAISMGLIFALMLILEPNVPISGLAKLDSSKLYSSCAPLILDYDGNPLSEPDSGRVRIGQLPDHVPMTFVAAEDKRFYNHNGIDYYRIAGAVVSNVRTRGYREGASTISQQLIKNTHLSQDKTMRRKINEVRIAKQLERQYDKTQILEFYLNALYFGNNIYGVGAAARYYFGISASALTIDQAAMLAAVINNPSKFSPIHNYDNAIARRNTILGRMLDIGAITEDEHNLSVSTKTIVNKTTPINGTYSTLALKEANRLLRRDLSGYTIVTYYNADTQASLIQSLKQPLPKTAGLVSRGIVVCNYTYGIIADYGYNGGNRSPASIIKPIIAYAPALERRLITPLTPIQDTPIDYNGYSPQNFRKVYQGWISCRDALADSSNVVAVRLLNMTGIDYAKSVAARLGISFAPSDNGLALALGGMSEGTTLTNLVGAYAALANGGIYSQPKYVAKILDPQGSLVYSHKPYRAHAIGCDTAYLTTQMLKRTSTHGTARRLKDLNFDIASKTGTSGGEIGNTDAYCLAYTTEHTMAVWYGSLRVPNPHILGGGVATNAMYDLMRSQYKDNPSQKFVTPNSVATYEIDSLELYHNNRIIKANNGTQNRATGVFSRNNPPRRKLDVRACFQ